ncbi:hypothetical protein [Streptomyces sp. NPDC086023]|uniref:hypothetical protein n=1 Tax=Streptomyces sp. NPDC086023 TaxID=3365746 RepID=UPI0037D82126
MSVLVNLGGQLESEDTAVALAAVWEVFHLCGGVADAVAFEEGSDELQALVASQKCAAARDLVPLPTTGSAVPVPLPGPGVDGLDPYVRLLAQVEETLVRLAGTADSVGEGAGQVLAEAASLASGAAAALAAVREGS